MELSSFQSNSFLLLFGAAAIHGFYLGTLLFFKSQKERGLGWLGWLMVPVSMWLLTYLFYIGGVMRTAPHLLGVFVPALYLMGPLFYFFVRRSDDPGHRFRRVDLLHLLPVLYVLWEWAPVYGWPEEAKIALIDRIYDYERPALSEMLRGNRLIFFVLAYVSAAGRYLYKRLRSSEERHARRQWLWRFTQTFAGLLVANLLIQMVFWTFRWNAAILELTLVLILSLAIHVLGYIVLGIDRVLPKSIRAGGRPKYATSPLSETQIDAHRRAILHYLEDERPWLNASFSIEDLAAALDIPRHHLSQVLSEGMRESFYGLVCRYRIAEVKRKLQSGEAEKYSILGIAADCGFGSKSSFNRAFRKETGTTPSDYLRTLKWKNAGTK